MFSRSEDNQSDVSGRDELDDEPGNPVLSLERFVSPPLHRPCPFATEQGRVFFLVSVEVR
jgi:hypothetical protein